MVRVALVRPLACGKLSPSAVVHKVGSMFDFGPISISRIFLFSMVAIGTVHCGPARAPAPESLTRLVEERMKGEGESSGARLAFSAEGWQEKKDFFGAPVRKLKGRAVSLVDAERCSVREFTIAQEEKEGFLSPRYGDPKISIEQPNFVWCEGATRTPWRDMLDGHQNVPVQLMKFVEKAHAMRIARGSREEPVKEWHVAVDEALPTEAGYCYTLDAASSGNGVSVGLGTAHMASDDVMAFAHECVVTPAPLRVMVGTSGQVSATLYREKDKMSLDERNQQKLAAKAAEATEAEEADARRRASQVACEACRVQRRSCRKQTMEAARPSCDIHFHDCAIRTGMDCVP